MMTLGRQRFGTRLSDNPSNGSPGFTGNCLVKSIACVTFFFSVYPKCGWLGTAAVRWEIDDLTIVDGSLSIKEADSDYDRKSYSLSGRLISLFSHLIAGDLYRPRCSLG